MKSNIAQCCFRLFIASISLVAEVQASISETDALYFYDEDASLSFDSVIELVRTGAINEKFDTAVVPLGMGKHWVIFSLNSGDLDAFEKWVIEVDFPNIDRVETLVKYPNGLTKRFLIGDDVAFENWPINYRKPSIPLDQLDHLGATIYFKISSETPLIFPLSFVTQEQQEKAHVKEQFLYGAFYGAIFILALYNAGIYFSLRNRSYLFYISYILAFSLVQASTTGLGQQYLWPAYDGATTRIALFAIILTNYFMVHFVIHFLELSVYRPRFVTPMVWVARAALLFIPTLFLEHYAYVQFSIHGLNFLGMLTILVATYSVLERNRRPAMYLLASYSVLFSAIIFATLSQTKFIKHYSYLDYSMSLAILVEAIILSIGLSEKIAQLRIENEQSERARRINQEKLSQQLIKTREYERAEISKLLHDSINHDLIVARNKIGQLSNTELTRSSTLVSDTQAINDILDRAISEIRNISHLSHPQIVKHLGLKSALNVLLESTFDSSISWGLYVDEVNLDYDSQLFLYRAVQESTTNIIKHAKASECLVRLHLDKKDNHVKFILKDDGGGFDASLNNWGFGLRTLNEHCKSLAGSLVVRSSVMSGTEVTITLPIKPKGVFDERSTSIS